MSTRVFACEYSRVRLRVLASTFASTREFVCEYSRVRLRVRARFVFSTLASFDSRVGSAPLACTCARAQMTLACDIASDASRSHSHVKLRLSGTVYIETLILQVVRKILQDVLPNIILQDFSLC